MNKEMMTLVGAFLNPKQGFQDGDERLDHHFAVVSLVTGDRKIARLSMNIVEAAELCFLPSDRFMADMRLAEDPHAHVKRRETLKHKAAWIAKGQEFAAKKAAGYLALHGAAPDPEFVELWGQEGYRYAGQSHMAACLKKYEATQERREARLMARHAKWAFSMFQRTLADGTCTRHGYPSNIGGTVMVEGHRLEQVFSKKGVTDDYNITTFPPVRFKLWGEDRLVFKVTREHDTVPLKITFLGMPHGNVEVDMRRKVAVDDAARLAFARGQLS